MRTMSSLAIGIVLVVVGCAVADAAAPDSLWMRAYGDTLWQQARCIIETSDGGFALAGYTTILTIGGVQHTDVYVVRLATDGDTLWTNHYGGPGADVGYGIRQTSDGGYIVAGYSGYVDDPANRQVYLVKLDSLGALQWERRYGGVESDEAYDVQVLVGDGGFLVAGQTRNNTWGADVYLLRTDSDGDTLFTRQYHYTISDAGYSVCETTDGYVVCGYVQGSQSYDVLLLKTNSHLDSLWSRTYGGPGGDVGNSIKLTIPDFGFIVGAYRTPPESGKPNGWALRTNSRGDTLWTVTMLDSVVNRFNSVDVTSDGGYVFAGLRDLGSLLSRDFYVVKLASGGAVDWETTYGTAEWEDVALSIEQIQGGDFIIAGGGAGLSGTPEMDAFVVKTGLYSGLPAGPVAGGSAVMLQPYPNPTTGSAVVAFDLAFGGRARIGVYDVAGRLVADLFGGELSPGRHSFEWNGRNAAGSDAPGGVYFCVLRVGGVEVSRKTVLVR